MQVNKDFFVVVVHCLLTSDLPKKIVPPESALFLPPVFDGDKYEVLSAHLKTVLLNGFCTINLMKSLLDTVHILSEDVPILKVTVPFLSLKLINCMKQLVIVLGN
jgi:hypothetical protein